MNATNRITVWRNPHLIEDHLYLGNQQSAESEEVLRRLDIRYVLSVFDSDLETKLDSVTYKKIDVSDSCREELITHFQEAIDFIGGAQKAGHNVLVHCFMGVSRSAAIVVAFVMNKYSIPYEEALDRVRERRLGVEPNPGFAVQLKLYEEMQFTINANNPRLRRLFVDILLSDYSYDFYQILKVVNPIKKYFAKRDLIESLTEDLRLGRDCLCVECAFKLFNEIHIIANTLPEDATKDSKSCDYTFIEPQHWMNELSKEFDEMEASVKCPKCGQSVVELNNQFTLFSCECDAHNDLNYCLRFRVKNSKFKVESKN